MDWKLRPHPRTRACPGPVVVVVMDGVGVGPDNEGNAVRRAHAPTLRHLMATAPYRTLRAHGRAVGLPSDDDMGNSEVGHNALGAGRIYNQGAKLVNEAIASGAMFKGPVWQGVLERARRGGVVHFLGLLSDGNVHSHQEHLYAMLRDADRAGVERICVHALLDGRDVPETSALLYVEALERELAAFRAKGRQYRVASGGGRMKVTMDRYEADWGMVALGWKTHVQGEGDRFPSLEAAVRGLRERHPGVIDQDLPAFVIADEGGPVGPIRDGDAVVFFNFRGDRAIEISRAFEDESMPHFARGPRPDVYYCGMMQYDGDYQIPKRYLVEPPAIEGTMGEFLARNRVTQFACSETQKYGHVTYFWNGNRSGKFDEQLETYVEVKSDRVSFSERPWMKAAEITDATIAAIESGQHRFLRINYANGDMVGHTGQLDATILAVGAVDLCLARLLKVVERAHGIALITADHGNADEMFQLDKKGAIKRDAQGRTEAKTSHTLNPVPLHVYDASGGSPRVLRADLADAGIGNLAATALELLGFAAPDGYLPSLLG